MTAARHPVDSLGKLEADIVACRACPRLVAWREQVAAEKRAAYRDEEYWGRPVPGFGDPHARILVVGLAPAAHGANRTGRMFTGDRSGEWLYRALFRAGLANQAESTSRDDGLVLDGVYISAPVRCAPPANKPTPDERAACAPYFARELALLPDIRVIVALGAIGYQAVAALVGLTPRPRFGHGVTADLPDGRTILCSYHVSQQNTFTGKLTEVMLDEVFSKARALASSGVNPRPEARGEGTTSNRGRPDQEI